MVFVGVLFKLALTNVVSYSTLEFYPFLTMKGCMMTCLNKPSCRGIFYSKHLQGCRLARSFVDVVHEEGWDLYLIQEDRCLRQLNYTLVYLPAPFCYKVYGDLRMSYSESLSHCEADGGSLLTLETQEKNDFIRNALMNMNVRNVLRIGLIEINGTWVWSSSGADVSYDGWGTNEPNNLQDEFCGALLKNMEYRWIDYTCNNPKTFICEIDMSNS